MEPAKKTKVLEAKVTLYMTEGKHDALDTKVKTKFEYNFSPETKKLLIKAAKKAFKNSTEQ